MAGLRRASPLAQDFVVHRDLADLGAQALDLGVAFVRISRLERRLPAGREVVAPQAQRRAADAKVTRDRVQRLAAQQAQDGLRLAPG